MARITLVSGSDPAGLLRSAAAPFLVEGRPAEPLPILAVRQGGLRDEVHRLASAAGCSGWIGTPLLVFAELPALIAGDRAPLTEFERRALIHAAIDRVRPRTLPTGARRTIVDALDRVFGDLAADEVAPDALRSALASLHGDTWERGRDEDLVALHEEYRRQLAALPPRSGIARTDGRDGIALAARAVREQPELVRQRLRRPFDRDATPRALHLYGLADLRRGWRALLDALHASDVVTDVRIHLLDPAADTEDEAEPLRAWLRARADSTVRIACPSAQQGAAVRATEAPDVTRELDDVARAVKRLIVQHGATPHEIAVIARKARPYLTRAAATFAAHGIPVHARLRHTIAEVSAVAALLRLFQVASGGWRIKELEALASSPYFDIPLDRGIMRRALETVQGRGLAAWRTALEDLRRTVEHAGPDDEEDALPPLDRVERAIAKFDAFAATVQALDGRRTTADWIVLTNGIITAAGDGSFLGYGDLVDPAGVDDAARELRDAVRLDGAALVHATGLLEEWKAALAHDPDADRQLDAAAWATELETVLGETEVTIRTGHAGGVQLLEALSAEGRSFAHVFVLGLESGAFPADPVPDALFADEERARLAAAGMPMEPSAVWLAREETLFRNIVRSARDSLALSWCYADANGAPVLASAFAEDTMLRAGIAADTIPGSCVVPEAPADAWSAADALRMVGAALSEGDASPEMLTALGLVAADPDAAPAVHQMLHAAALEQVRQDAREAPAASRAGRAHAWNGDVSDEASRTHLAERFGERVWSATQLERIGRCAFSFLAGTALGVRDGGDIDPDDADARDIGSARHVALSRIYPRLVASVGLRFSGVAPTDEQRETIAAVVLEEVDRAIDEQGGSWTKLAGLRRARVQELAAEMVEYIAWEMESVKKFERAPLYTELGFGMEGVDRPPATLDAGDGRVVRLKGQIDRVDRVLVDGRPSDYLYVVDHKSSDTALKPLGELQAAGAVLQLALYLHALKQVEPGAKIWGGTYQLRKGARTGALERCSNVKAGLQELGNPTQKKHDATIEGAAAMAADLVQLALAGRLPAATPGTTDCLHYCDYRDVCREDRMKPKTW